MGRRWIALGAVLVVLVGAVAPAAGASDRSRTPTRAELRRVAVAAMDATRAPGVIVAVQVGSHRPVTVARGSTRRIGGVPMRTDSPFLSASVSKAFTAVALLALVRDHRLRLSDPVVRYVPGWDRRITVRMLLDHSSGLRSWGNKDDPDSRHDDLRSADFDRVFMPTESLEPVRTAPLLAAPGTATHYSNANTILAGEVVAAVTHSTVGRAIDRYVARPLHLRSTGYAPEDLAPRAPVSGVLWFDDAQTTEVETALYPLTSLLTLSGPSIGVVSDAPDLLRFARAFLRGSFPTPRLARTANTVGTGGAGLGVIGFTRRGYCIFDGCPRGARFVRRGFAGNMEGSAVRVVHDSRLDATVLVFANSSEGTSLDPLVRRTFALVAPDH